MKEQNREQHLENIKKLLCDLGEDPERDGLVKTPERHLNSLKFLTSGYSQDASKILNSALFDVEYDEMVVVRDIEVYSLCEHHMLPFFGKCHVAYIPRKKVVGLSKIPRVVDIFCRRLQVQERLTDQISHAVQECLNPLGVGVVIEAYHLCMMMRGVEKQRSYTMTSSMKGSFRNQETRNEFLSFIRMRREG